MPRKIADHCIEAGQLVYTNVEAERSPRGKSGRQVLLYSHDLTDQEVKEIEKRLFYAPRDSQPVKEVFFHLATKKTVIARIVPLSETDKAGRRGLSLAHALVINTAQFRCVYDANPFFLLDQKELFFTSVELALEKKQGKLDDIAKTQLPLPAPTTSAVVMADRYCTAESLRLLIALAVEAEALVAAKKSIAFFGLAEELGILLRAIFRILPKRYRLHCTFDTVFSDGSTSRLPYWAIGLPTSHPRPMNLLTYGLSKKRFEGEIRPPHTSDFVRWLFSSDVGLEELQLKMEQACRIGEVLEEPSELPLRTLTTKDLSLAQKLDAPNDPRPRLLARKFLHDSKGLLESSTLESIANHLVANAKDHNDLLNRGHTDTILLKHALSAHSSDSRDSTSNLERISRFLKDLHPSVASSNEAKLLFLVFLLKGARWEDLQKRIAQFSDIVCLDFIATSLATLQHLKTTWKLRWDDKVVCIEFCITSPQSCELIDVCRVAMQMTEVDEAGQSLQNFDDRPKETRELNSEWQCLWFFDLCQQAYKVENDCLEFGRYAQLEGMARDETFLWKTVVASRRLLEDQAEFLASVDNLLQRRCNRERKAQWYRIANESELVLGVWIKNPDEPDFRRLIGGVLGLWDDALGASSRGIIMAEPPGPASKKCLKRIACLINARISKAAEM